MTFLMNTWYVSAWQDEFDDRPAVARTIAGVPLLMMRGTGGEVTSMQDRCPHRLVPLSTGHFEDGTVTCAYHGLRFAASGTCIGNPHGPIVQALDVRTFPTVCRHDAVWVWLGDPENADDALIPDLSFIPPTLPTAQSHGYEPIAANYQLCTDNILDLSHADFLHPNSLGGGATTRAKSRVEANGKHVRIEWFAENDIPPPALRGELPSPDTPIDLRISVDWHAPGIMILHFGGTPTGHPPEEGPATVNAHIMTPQDETNTHYFFWNSRNFRKEDGQYNQMLADMLRHAFGTEDKTMLQAQQAVVGRADFDSLGPVLLRTDAGPVQVRRALAKMIAAECL